MSKKSTVLVRAGLDLVDLLVFVITLTVCTKCVATSIDSQTEAMVCLKANAQPKNCSK